MKEGGLKPITRYDRIAYKAHDLACKFIADKTGSCPFDLLRIEPLVTSCAKREGQGPCPLRARPNQCWQGHFYNEGVKEVQREDREAGRDDTRAHGAVDVAYGAYREGIR